MHCVFGVLSPPVLAICLEFALCLVMLKLHSRSNKVVVQFVKMCMLTLEVVLSDFACNFSLQDRWVKFGNSMLQSTMLKWCIVTPSEGLLKVERDEDKASEILTR